MTILPWRRKVEAWIGQDRQDNDIRDIIKWVAKLERKIDEMDDGLKAKFDALSDVVKAAESAMDALKAAADYLRSHPVTVDDPATKAELEALKAEVANKVDAVAADLAEKVKAVAASGGVSG